MEKVLGKGAALARRVSAGSLGLLRDAGRSPATAGQPIMAPGQNVWRIEKSTRTAFLVDAKAYFCQLEQALKRARHCVWILGWDFNGQIRLCPDQPDKTATLGEILRAQVEKHPHMQVFILIWAFGAIYSQRTLNRSALEPWADHPRIHIRLDGKHPLRASHHQKLVCIDDHVAFAGGIDLTVRRWDTTDHAASDKFRLELDGVTPYTPVHDTQMAVEGDAACALGDLARERWYAATGEEYGENRSRSDCWPSGLEPDLVDAEVGIARTIPGSLTRKSIREAADLTLDALASARRTIYMEAQYFASGAVGRVLEERLKAPDGPEVVVFVTKSAHGVFEQLVMGGNRDRLIRRLKKADRYDRLRVMYPVVPDEENGGECEVLIHSKLIIVDDRFVRIGSSNLNNRSIGLDTECDLAVEAKTGAESFAIASLRERLVAEHIGSTPEVLKAVVGREGSLVRAIDKLNTGLRGVRHFDVGDGGTAPMPGTGLLDPKMPYWPLQVLPRRLREFAQRLSGWFL